MTTQGISTRNKPRYKFLNDFVPLGLTVIQQECLVGNYLLCYCFSVDKELNHLGQCSTRLYCDAVLGSFDSRFMGSIEHMKTRKELEKFFSGAKIAYS